MYRGNLPGFYWDSAKGKYFKVQADSNAPANAAYAQGNFRKQEREKKRVETRERHKQELLRQTITRNPLLRHPLLGASSLRREHSAGPSIENEKGRSLALVQGLRSSHLTVHVPDHDRNHITDAQHVPGTPYWLVSVSHTAGSHCLYLCMHDNSKLVKAKALHAFHTPIINVWCISVRDVDLVVACAAEATTSGNLFVNNVTAEDTVSSAYVTGLGFPEPVVDSKLGYDKVACACSRGVFVHDLENRQMQQLICGDSALPCACEWLDCRTLAFGVKSRHDRSPKRTTYSHHVFLWDTRADGVSMRITRAERINGLHKPVQESSCLLIGSAHEIALYDLRMLGNQDIDINNANTTNRLRQQPALLSIPHTTQTPRLDLTTYNNSCIAAVDWENHLQVYSLLDGKLLRTLGLAKGTVGMMARPKWQEDDRGSPYLQVCAADTVQQWSWNSVTHS